MGMEGAERRARILSELSTAEQPISASQFAKIFTVSRQIVVGDVALLRAQGYAILATARGYVIEKEKDKLGVSQKIACKHLPEQTQEELATIVALGGEIIDVIVEHPIYGELTGGLHIKNNEDIEKFIHRYTMEEASLLSELTTGIHLHTIRCRNEQDLTRIQQALGEKQLLYVDNE